MRLAIVNLFMQGERIRERKRSAGILARKPGELNPPYAGRRNAAGPEYRVRVVKLARRERRPCESRDPYAVPYLGARWKLLPAPTTACGYGSPLSRGRRLHRRLAVPHRRAGADGFRRVDDRVGVHAVVAIEFADAAGLAEMLDPERLDAVAAHAAEPAERRGMAVDHGDDAAIARQRRQQLFDVAQMLHAVAVAL